MTVNLVASTFWGKIYWKMGQNNCHCIDITQITKQHYLRKIVIIKFASVDENGETT